MFNLKDHLKQLVESHAPSGHEGPIRATLRQVWQPYVDQLDQDGLGSLIAVKHGTRRADPPRKIMLAAHMDEIGMMVREVRDGFVLLHRISGVDNRIMPAQTVRVHGRQPLSGIVATTPPHLRKEHATGKYPTFDELIVDVGLPAAEVARLVAPGDLVTVDVPLLELENDLVAGKAMDDRACVAAVTVCLDLLQRMQHQWDVYAVATVQEETGLHGARTAAYRIQPDIAIALDVTFASQPGVDTHTCEPGDGPGIGLGPNFHPKLVEQIRQTASYHEITLQDDPIAGPSGTDAWAIQIANEGVPSVLLQVPLRNMHSPIETCSLKDIERAGRLMAHFIAGLQPDFMTTIAYEGATS